MKSLRSLLAPAAVVLAAAAVAFAGDKTPVVKSASCGPAFDPGKGPAGGNVLVTGRNFGEVKESVQVTIENQECQVLEVAPESLRFLLPVVANGKHKIKVQIKGGDSTTFDFEIVTKTDDARKREAKAFETPGDQERIFVEKKSVAIKITKFELVAGDSPSATIEGTTTLPDGFELHIALGFSLPQGMNTEERTFESKLVKIRKEQSGNVFSIKFGPYPGKTLLAGRYFVDVIYDVKKQSRVALKRAGWPDKLTAQEKQIMAEINARDYKDSLTPADREKQEEDHRTHYNELAARASTLMTDLERAYVAAGKSYFKKGTTFDEAEWEKWAEKRLSPEEIKRAKSDARFVTKGFTFAAEKWQGYLESDLFAPLNEVTRKHTTQKAKYVGDRDPQAETLGDHMLTIILGLTQAYSTEIYTKNKMPVPDGLRAPKDVDLSGLQTSVRLSRAYLESQKRQLLDRIPQGVDKPDNKKKPAEKPAEK